MNKLRILSLSLLACAGVARADDAALATYCESLAKMCDVHISDVKSGIQARILAEKIAKDNMDAATLSNAGNAGTIGLFKTRADNLLNKTKHFSYDNYTLRITGANLNIRHGATAEVANNGLGNLIIGTNQGSTGPVRSGSLNLIIGPEHGWKGRYNMIGGYGAMSKGDRNVLLSGYKNEAWGSDGVILTGNSNLVVDAHGFVATGYNCIAGDKAVVLTGTSNNAHTFAGFIVTGTGNDVQAEGWNGFIGTGTSNYVGLSGGIGVGKTGGLGYGSTDWTWLDTSIK